MDKNTNNSTGLQDRQVSWQIIVKSNKIEGTSPLYKAVQTIIGNGENGLCIKNEITKLRAIRNEDEGRYKTVKQELPVILFTGVFKTRANDKCIKGSGLAIADLDEIDPENMNKVFNVLTDIPFIVMVFRSPSNEGLKVVYQIPETTDNNEYRELGTAFSNLFITKVGNLVKVDIRANKDIARACFVSWDPDIYVNYQAETWTERADKNTLTTVGTIGGKIRYAHHGHRKFIFNTEHMLDDLYKQKR